MLFVLIHTWLLRPRGSLHLPEHFLPLQPLLWNKKEEKSEYHIYK